MSTARSSAIRSTGARYGAPPTRIRGGRSPPGRRPP
jgi:hypothetical protein